MDIPDSAFYMILFTVGLALIAAITLRILHKVEKQHKQWEAIYESSCDAGESQLQNHAEDTPIIIGETTETPHDDTTAKETEKPLCRSQLQTPQMIIPDNITKN